MRASRNDSLMGVIIGESYNDFLLPVRVDFDDDQDIRIVFANSFDEGCVLRVALQKVGRHDRDRVVGPFCRLRNEVGNDPSRVDHKKHKCHDGLHGLLSQDRNEKANKQRNGKLYSQMTENFSQPIKLGEESRERPND